MSDFLSVTKLTNYDLHKLCISQEQEFEVKYG